RQNVRADFRAFLQHTDRELRVQLLDSDRGGKARWAGADHNHVKFHRLTFHEGPRRITNGSLKNGRASQQVIGTRPSLRPGERLAAILKKKERARRVRPRSQGAAQQDLRAASSSGSAWKRSATRP